MHTMIKRAGFPGEASIFYLGYYGFVQILKMQEN